MKKTNKNLATLNNNINKGWKNDGFDNYVGGIFDFLNPDMIYLNRMQHLHDLEISLVDTEIKNVYEVVTFGHCNLVLDVCTEDIHDFKIKRIKHFGSIKYSFYVYESSTWLDLWKMVDHVVVKEDLDFQFLDRFDFIPTPKSRHYTGIIRPFLRRMD